MEEMDNGKRWLSPRKQSWVAVIVPYLVFVLAVSFLPIHVALIAVAAAALGAGAFRLLQKCPACGVSVSRVRVEFLGVPLRIYTPLAPRRCLNGHPLD